MRSGLRPDRNWMIQLDRPSRGLTAKTCRDFQMRSPCDDSTESAIAFSLYHFPSEGQSVWSSPIPSGLANWQVSGSQSEEWRPEETHSSSELCACSVFCELLRESCFPGYYLQALRSVGPDPRSPLVADTSRYPSAEYASQVPSIHVEEGGRWKASKVVQSGYSGAVTSRNRQEGRKCGYMPCLGRAQAMVVACQTRTTISAICVGESGGHESWMRN